MKSVIKKKGERGVRDGGADDEAAAACLRGDEEEEIHCPPGSMKTEEKESNVYYIDIELTTKNRVHLARVMRKIRSMPEVQKVSRHSQNRQN